MKKKILFATISSIIATLSIQSSADYLIKYQIEPTPNSIIIKGWFDTEAIVSDWSNTGNAFNCGVFTPLENTITINQSFEQSRNCSVNQERIIQNRKISENGTYKNEGSPIVESRIDSIIEKNNSTGTLETWELTTPTSTGWVNSGTYYGCTNWTPLANTIPTGTPFVQTASDCKLNQTQNRQDREIEKTTGVIRNKGTVVVETQTLMNQTTTQNSIGTKANKFCYYDETNFGNYSMWWDSTSSHSQIYVEGYKNLPLMWVYIDTLIHPLGYTPYQYLTKISNTEILYNNPNNIIKLTKGAFVYQNAGFSYYEVCYE